MAQTHMEATDVIVVLDALSAAGVDCWLGGGWGIDALVGLQTRPHEDLDLVLGMGDVAQTINTLREMVFEIDEDLRPISFTMCSADGQKVDLHPVTWNAEGGGIQAQPNNATWTYPAEGFQGVGEVVGHRVRCLTAKVQILCHDGYQLDAADFQDLELLRSVLSESEVNT